MNIMEAYRRAVDSVQQEIAKRAYIGDYWDGYDSSIAQNYSVQRHHPATPPLHIKGFMKSTFYGVAAMYLVNETNMEKGREKGKELIDRPMERSLTPKPQGKVRKFLNDFVW